MVSKLFSFLLILIMLSRCSSFLGGNAETDPIKREQNLIERYRNHGTPLGVKLYGKYAEDVPGNYVMIATDQSKELFAKLKAENVDIKKAVDQADLTGYYEYSPRPYKYEPYVMDEKYEFYTITFATIDEVPIKITLSYDIEKRDGRENKDLNETYYINFFPEPIITIAFSIANAIPGYNRLYYTSDGELVGEGGKWFLYVDRDKYVDYYLKEALRIMGKD